MTVFGCKPCVDYTRCTSRAKFVELTDAVLREVNAVGNMVWPGAERKPTDSIRDGVLDLMLNVDFMLTSDECPLRGGN